MDTLAFGYILPTTGWIRDFNPLETCAARRTQKKQHTAVIMLYATFIYVFTNITNINFSNSVAQNLFTPNPIVQILFDLGDIDQCQFLDICILKTGDQSFCCIDRCQYINTCLDRISTDHESVS